MNNVRTSDDPVLSTIYFLCHNMLLRLMKSLQFTMYDKVNNQSRHQRMSI